MLDSLDIAKNAKRQFFIGHPISRILKEEYDLRNISCVRRNMYYEKPCCYLFPLFPHLIHIIKFPDAIIFQYRIPITSVHLLPVFRLSLSVCPSICLSVSSKGAQFITQSYSFSFISFPFSFLSFCLSVCLSVCII